MKTVTSVIAAVLVAGCSTQTAHPPAPAPSQTRQPPSVDMAGFAQAIVKKHPHLSPVVYTLLDQRVATDGGDLARLSEYFLDLCVWRVKLTTDRLHADMAVTDEQAAKLVGALHQACPVR